MERHEEQGIWSLLLSHKPDDKLHLCFRWRALGWTFYFCPRCSGVLLSMLLTLFLGRALGPFPGWLTWGLLLLAPLPALFDWGTSLATGRPERGNGVRFATGIGLGAGLGTNLYVNTYALLSPPVITQITFLLASIWVVWLSSYLRRRRRRRQRRSLA